MLIGMEERDIQRYSLRRALHDRMNGTPPADGLEKECHDELRKHRSRPNVVEGTGVPWDIFCTPRMTRSLMNRNRLTRAPADMQVSVFGQGGALVPTQVAEEPIELLRNHICCARLGATVLDGLSAFFAIPRQIAPTVPGFLPETQQVNETTAQLDQLLVSPHRVSCDCAYSKQLMLQSAVAIENFLRQDLLRQLGILFDFIMLNGTGGQSQPTGLLQTIGIGTTTFAGAATWSSILQFENLIAQANADVPGARMAWLTTPGARNKLKGVAVALTGASTVSSRPIWEPFNWQDGTDDGSVNQYRAAVSNNVQLDRMIFGNWRELILAIWVSGIDILSNPYTRSKEGIVELTLNAYVDVCVRHSQSFVVSNDAATQ